MRVISPDEFVLGARDAPIHELDGSLSVLPAGPHALQPLGTDGAASFLRDVVHAAAQTRGLLPRAATRHLEIDDPYGSSTAVYRRSADAVAEHVDRLASALAAIARG